MPVQVNTYADPAWVTKYIGIPAVPRGFSFDGAHCWGSVHLAFAQERGIELPLYGALSADDIVAAARAFRRGKSLPPWRHIASAGKDEPGESLVARVVKARLLRVFDVVLMLHPCSISGRYIEAHVGLMIGPQKLIHTEEGYGTVKAELYDPLVSWRVSGFYRHEALA